MQSYHKGNEHRGRSRATHCLNSFGLLGHLRVFSSVTQFSFLCFSMVAGYVSGQTPSLLTTPTFLDKLSS